MEMHQIRYFLAVCETLNFTRAAEQCYVTQPALTRAVQKLEEELGGLLFRRGRHLTLLTDLGRPMRPQFEQIWQQTEAAKTTAQSFLKLEDATLKSGPDVHDRAAARDRLSEQPSRLAELLYD